MAKLHTTAAIVALLALGACNRGDQATSNTQGSDTTSDNMMVPPADDATVMSNDTTAMPGDEGGNMSGGNMTGGNMSGGNMSGSNTSTGTTPSGG
ncbi:hypothetical protein [Rhizorhabdus argentea]|uniref:hypothetical protein n=1 Tax=Rhizorhabdus argentea TaxID=1387174 RepID=UPI0030EFA05F